MNDLEQLPLLKGPPPSLPTLDRDTAPPPDAINGRSRSGRRLLGLGVLVLFLAALALGVWRHYQQHQQVMDTAQPQANFVPSVHVEHVAQRLGRLHVTLPATGDRQAVLH
jgi:cytochrome c-type biogenesis protein CcmH/NrfG